MIGRSVEYEKMFAVERDLWWYRTLHGRVLDVLAGHFSTKKLRILDAGCGTGGMLERLRDAGYADLRGFDASPDAVAFTRQRGFSLETGTLQDMPTLFPGERFDVVICNDVITYLSDEEIVSFFREVRQRILPGGLFITNNCALRVFYGAHDVAVASLRRFSRPELRRLGAAAGFQAILATYWSLVLSPLILAVRSAQRFSLRRGWLKPDAVTSDVVLPVAPLNAAFTWLNRLERRWLRRAPFGSSVFVVFSPETDAD